MNRPADRSVKQHFQCQKPTKSRKNSHRTSHPRIYGPNEGGYSCQPPIERRSQLPLGTPFPIGLKSRCSAQEESLRLREFTCDPFPVPEVAEGDSYRPLRCSTH